MISPETLQNVTNMFIMAACFTYVYHTWRGDK